MTSVEQAPAGPSLADVARVVGDQRAKARRGALIAGVAGLAVGAGAVGSFSLLGGAEEQGARASVTLATVAAESRDVSLYTEYAGTLGYGDAVDVVTRAQGVLTAVPAAGADVTRGGVAFEVDEEPVVLLYGSLPAWRSLSTASDDGPDVLQLELNLAALGYGSGVTVDESFTAATAAALKALETAIGQSEPDGVLDQGEVVFTSGPIRVDDVLTRGTSISAGTSVITAALLENVTDAVGADGAVASTGTPTQAVTFTIASDDQGAFAVGDAVTIELADGRLTDGIVNALSDTPRRNGTGPSAELVLDVTVAITSVPEDGLIEGPANVRVTDETRSGLTMVPVRALVAVAGGGYAVSVIDDAGASTYVAVDTGLFQDGWVEVTGDVAPGDTVEVPQ